MEVHKEEKVYVPELIFGHLLTSSNYDDNEKKVRSRCWLPCKQGLRGQLGMHPYATFAHDGLRAERLTPDEHWVTACASADHGWPQRLWCQADQHLLH